MALRNPHALLGTYSRAGVLCLAPEARTCIDHGLPETPDTFSLTLLKATGLTLIATMNCTVGGYLESWNSVSMVFNNCFINGVYSYLTCSAEHSIVR